jgi:hypothetical protein
MRRFTTNRKLRILFILVFSGLLFLSYRFSRMRSETETNLRTDCRIHDEACTKSLPNGLVTFDINPKPVTVMKDLDFTVTIQGNRPTDLPHIDLSMPGMDMGPNRVLLEPAAENVWEGQGVIVHCPSGSRIWKATVTIPGMGAVEFVFDVVHAF